MLQVNGGAPAVPTYRGILLLILLAFCLPVLGQGFAPAVLWPAGEFNDKNPFPLKVYEGVTLFERFHNVDVIKLRGPSKQRLPIDILRQAIAQDANPIIAFGVAYYDALRSLAHRNPEIDFVLVDGFGVDAQNVVSVTFANEQGGYLMGKLAAVVSTSGRIGFVGGMDNAAIRNFACGYAQGAKEVDPEVLIKIDMVGTTAQAFNDPKTAKELALAQYNSGVDIIFHASGGSGMGVFEAAEQASKYAIGVDANQNGIKPGLIVTSLLKRIDVVAYNLLDSARLGQLRKENYQVGIKEGALDWALDQHNVDLIDPTMKQMMDISLANISAGRVMVHRESEHGLCPFTGASGAIR